MDDLGTSLEQVASAQALLGYLNFASGKPDPRFQKALNDLFTVLEAGGLAEPWSALHDHLQTRLRAVRDAGAAAFRDTTQAEAVLTLVLLRLPPAYRTHHAELLRHRSDRDLWPPLAMARGFEAVLLQGGPWSETERVLAGAVAALNDYVGHRPIAVLENRSQGEPYPHERVRPIPLHLRGLGAGAGPYRELVRDALALLESLSAEGAGGILQEAHFDLANLDEFALDPRAYDHLHPVNRRPNYAFGEWDPHQIDNRGYYRRFVVRDATLDALRDWAARGGFAPLEAAAALAGTVLMAAATSGFGPSAHDSGATLATRMPAIARVRDRFYQHLLASRTGDIKTHLRQDADRTRQPFGSVRQHLNHHLARQRAAQLQYRHLAVLLARMGYPDAAREEAARIPPASARLLSEVHARLATGRLLADRGDPIGAATVLPEVDELLRRGIDCGAIADPWNFLGFQGLFPLSPAREESVQDGRLLELAALVEAEFDLAARLMSEAAARGLPSLLGRLTEEIRRRASWWDEFASSTVDGVPRLHGGEAADSAEQVAAALGRWHERGEAPADLAFWRRHLDHFRSPKSFALVVSALLDRRDHLAAQGLLMSWLSQSDDVPLEGGGHAFHDLALSWMLSLGDRPGNATDAWPLARRFLGQLEANAEELWEVPSLEPSRPTRQTREDDVYGAAYEEMTYRDSTDDDVEGSLADDGPPAPEEFDLHEEAERLSGRLRFLALAARLWQLAARLAPVDAPDRAEVLGGWLDTAERHQGRLLGLLDALHAHPIPEPLGAVDALVEYDRRRQLKSQLVHAAIATCLDTTLAVGTLRGASGRLPDASSAEPATGRVAWEPVALQLEQRLLAGNTAEVQRLLPIFLVHFRVEPLRFTPLSEGGEPRQILRARTAQAVLRALLTALPRQGLLREMANLLREARVMELLHTPRGPAMTEFNHLFEAALTAATECVVDSAAAWPEPTGDEGLIHLLEGLAERVLPLWSEHAAGLRLSPLERLADEEAWESLRDFIRKYGRDLFHARFLTLGNLRGVLQRGVGAWLDSLEAEQDPLHPLRLLSDLGRAVSREQAIRHLETVFQALVDEYEIFKDYNTTTTQSDYGENLYQLLEFLDVKAEYDRQAWLFRPLVIIHGVLARRGAGTAARRWEDGMRDLSTPLAAEHREELAALEQEFGMRLRTVSDRIEEAFVRPLALDRLCARVAPAMAEATSGGGEAFATLRSELGAFTAAPVGSGLTAPYWLQRLEAEVDRVAAEREAIPTLAREHGQVPRRLLSAAELRAQIVEEK